MTTKSLGKKVCDYICLTASAIAAIVSTSSAVKADENAVLGRLRPMHNLEYALEDTVHPMPALSQSIIRNIEDFSENRLLGIPQKYANWYLADFLMLAVHEQGHYEEIYNQGGNPSVDYFFTPFSVGGKVSSGGFKYKSKKDRARMNIAGFKNTGYLAEALKQEILMEDLSNSELKFKSMLALACELNLPFYVGQDYFGIRSDNIPNDIENFSNNSGISPETMAISSGIHMLVNAPYIYHLAKNALGSSPTAPEKKDYFLSFRYDGDSYMLYFHSDLNTIVEKLPKQRFMLMHGAN